MRTINEIIVHCSATAEGRDFTAADIDRWHRERGFGAVYGGKTYHIGYHYVVRLDGTVETGRPEPLTGAHCKGHNSHSIGVCYIGGLAKDGKTPKDTRTPKQKDALINLLMRLRRSYPQASIHGHRDYAAKACPSFNAAEEYKDI